MKIRIIFEKKFQCKVSKYSKIFQNNYSDSLIVLFYNQEYIIGSNPDYILVFNNLNLLNNI